MKAIEAFQTKYHFICQSGSHTALLCRASSFSFQREKETGFTLQ